MDMEYKTKLDRVMHYIDRKADFGKTISVANAKRAAAYAYNAGRQSAVDNIPELEWSKTGKSLIAITPISNYSIYILELRLYANGVLAKGVFPTIDDAKQAANEDYKKRIKQALGI